ncbi:hypothetical protein DFJ69_4172 [Thermomonospora umbrina]|uniref:Uncharacterized protein n=1 Tax=Thermomonospora umbrina TaxID=111806 RepID=A0A3D9SRU3_9ACTN|nr:hypothetical protein DFJ69_4172 [Thermomonospora umbrina]
MDGGDYYCEADVHTIGRPKLWFIQWVDQRFESWLRDEQDDNGVWSYHYIRLDDFGEL